MTFNQLEENKRDGEKPSFSALMFDSTLVDTNTTMVEAQRSRLQNLLDRVMRGAFDRNEDYRFLGTDKWHQFVQAFTPVRADEDGQGHVRDFAPVACKAYVKASQAVAKELHSIHGRFRVLCDDPELDDSQLRVEAKRLRIRHDKASTEFLQVLAQRKNLPDDHGRYIRFNSKGKYRWCADFIPDAEFFNWPYEVKYREHISLLQRWIAEIDNSLTEYREVKATEV